MIDPASSGGIGDVIIVVGNVLAAVFGILGASAFLALMYCIASNILRTGKK